MAELLNKHDLSEEFRKKFEALNKKQEAEFRRLLGEPPDVKPIPDAFWKKVERDHENELAAALLLLFLPAYDGHRTWADVPAPTSTSQRDKIAGAWSAKRASTVAQGLVKHSVDMYDTALRKWELKSKAGTPVTPDDLDELIGKLFGPSRVSTIVATESQQAMIEGGEAGVTHGAKAAGLQIARYWGHSGRRPPGHCGATTDPCPLCTPLEGLHESLWGSRFPGQCHPGCDCFVVYVDSADFVIGTAHGNLRPGNTPGKVWKFRRP